MKGHPGLQSKTLSQKIRKRNKRPSSILSMELEVVVQWQEEVAWEGWQRGGVVVGGGVWELGTRAPLYSLQHF
jgi:hypothetical protein